MIEDPFFNLYPLYQQWVGLFDWFGDIFPTYFILLIKLVLLFYSINILYIAFPLYRTRSKRRTLRKKLHLNGLGEIISRSRVGIALDMVHIALTLLSIGIVALLTPPPVRPTITFYTFFVSVAFIFLGYKCLHGIRQLSSADREAAKYLHRTKLGSPAPYEEFFLDEGLDAR